MRIVVVWRRDGGRSRDPLGARARKGEAEDQWPEHIQAILKASTRVPETPLPSQSHRSGARGAFEYQARFVCCAAARDSSRINTAEINSRTAHR